MPRTLICALSLALVCLGAGDASADRIQALTKRLAKSGSAKVRISAALSLAKTDDPRAIRALTRSLLNDRASSIRRVSAASLGQRLQKQTSPKLRGSAIQALKKASTTDSESKVRSTAKVALAKAGMQDSKTGHRARGVLVGVATPQNISRRLPRNTASLMQTAVKRIIREKAPAFVQTAPGTGMPSTAQLKKTKMKGYSVAPSISKLKLVKRGRSTVVQCEIKMRLAPWAGEGERWIASETATVTGSGSVTSGSSRRSVSTSSTACINAVVAQVTTNQVVPFLAAKGR